MIENKTTFDLILTDDILKMESSGMSMDGYYFNYIYALLLKGEIVYIGRSKNFPTGRITTHLKSSKVFDDVKIINITGDYDEDKLNGIEGALIMKHKPMYNNNFPKNKYWAKPKELRKILGISWSRYSKIIKGFDLSAISDIWDNTTFINVAEFKKQLLDL